LDSFLTIWGKLRVPFTILTPVLLSLSNLSAAPPLPVGAEKQVFIDGRFIDKSQGVALVVNRPRITGEKLIVPTHPWEDFYIGAYVSVIQDQDRIHMWYETADKRELRDLSAVAYAYSTDGGATWTRPKLGAIEYEGSRENNLVLTRVHGSTVFLNRPEALRASVTACSPANPLRRKRTNIPARPFTPPMGFTGPPPEKFLCWMSAV